MHVAPLQYRCPCRLQYKCPCPEALISRKGLHPQRCPPSPLKARCKLERVWVHWTKTLLSRSWNAWRAALTGWTYKQQRAAKAIAWWRNAALAGSWGSWVQLVGEAREGAAAAVVHERPRRLARCLRQWWVWSDSRWSKVERLRECRGHLASCKKHRVVQVRSGIKRGGVSLT